MAKTNPAVMRPDVIDINCETGEETIRPMNDSEFEAWKANAGISQ